MKIPAALAREKFVASPVARLATASPSGVPHLVPVTFACVGVDVGVSVEDDVGADDWLVFAVDHKPKTTMRLRRLANIEANPSVAFLVDEYDDDWARLWWVRADAQARLLDGAPRDRALAALRDKYRHYRAQPPGGPVVGARVTRWSGWRPGQANLPG